MKRIPESRNEYMVKPFDKQDYELMQSALWELERKYGDLRLAHIPAMQGIWDTVELAGLLRDKIEYHKMHMKK